MRNKNKDKTENIVRYYSFSDYLKKTFGKKVYKISLDGGMTCPNRDGTKGTSGCIFCSQGGSGDFAQKVSNESVDLAINLAKERVKNKTSENLFIAYFQSYTNTYASVEYLENLFMPVIMRSDICALSIGTRPDCLGDDVVQLIKKLSQIKPVFIELGLQTIHKTTELYIRRGYPLEEFDKAIEKLQLPNVNIVVHLILGLPQEDENMIIQSVDYVAKSKVHGIKLQLLHVLKDTDLANDFESGKFNVLEKEQYFSLLAKCVNRLPPDMVIHRLTGDAPKKLLIQPKWSANKKDVLNSLKQYFNDHEVLQGKDYKK